jgi:hypothetical protein
VFDAKVLLINNTVIPAQAGIQLSKRLHQRNFCRVTFRGFLPARELNSYATTAAFSTTSSPFSLRNN